MQTEQTLRTILAGLKTAYALVDKNGQISAHDDQFSAWFSTPQDTLAGANLLDILPEFIGQEDRLARVQDNREKLWQLENISRATSSGEAFYLTLTALPGQPEAALIILATNVTEQGQTLQELTQNRNELKLARRRLAELSYQLDTLLRYYLAPNVADKFLLGDLNLELGGDLREATILFADIRGFTTLSEELAPHDLVQLLNEHLDIVAKAITDANGIVIQFQGDNLIAVFNMFADQPEHATEAVEAGIALQQAIDQFQARQPPEYTQLQFGVGINTGTVLIGNVGSVTATRPLAMP